MKNLINQYFVKSTNYNNSLVALVLKGKDDYQGLYITKKDNQYFQIDEKRNEDIELINFDINDLNYLINNNCIFKLDINDIDEKNRFKLI